MRTINNEAGVSPVIGVVLMVAIVVILAAVVATFAFGLAGNINSTKNVAVLITQPDSNHIYATYHGGSDSEDLTSLTVSVVSGSSSHLAYETVIAGNPVAVGTVVTITSTDVPGGFLGEFSTGSDHVIVTGHFRDGVDQVVAEGFL